jgi:hypothetical protein
MSFIQIKDNLYKEIASLLLLPHSNLLNYNFLFKYQQYFSGSSILKSECDKYKLINLCDFDKFSKFRLVYRGSTDGFSGYCFHKHCDPIENTLVIIKTSESYIFGGFTKHNWSGKNIIKLDPDAFIFSLYNKDNAPIKIKCTPGLIAIQCYPQYGAVFGGNDICIHKIIKEHKLGYINYSNLGDSYRHPLYKEDREKARNFLANSKEFNVVEIEVFQKLD